MKFLSWALVFPALWELNSYTTLLLLAHLAGDRKLVRTTVHSWAVCAPFTGMGRDWRKGHIFLIGPPMGAICL